MNIVKRILISCAGGILLPILYFLIVAPITSAADTIRGRPWWAAVILFPIGWGGRLYKVFFPPEIDKSFVLLHWPTVIADFVGAFFFFAVLTYIFLFWRSRHLLLV
jgi:hypothetical protein